MSAKKKSANYVDGSPEYLMRKVVDACTDCDCCGIAGIMGFKKDFHDASIQMGSPLMEKIRQLDPEILVTDCLSCRLQFNQLSDYYVQHPIEIIRQSYE